MGTLASALQFLVDDQPRAPRVYVDANLPAGVVAAMRRHLGWDVLFVLEHEELRRLSDREHFVRALDLQRTLITLDQDFADGERFPPALSPGVIVCSAPDERVLLALLSHADRELLRPSGAVLPLRGRTLALTPTVAFRPKSRRA
jgi:hypothetical protein